MLHVPFVYVYLLLIHMLSTMFFIYSVYAGLLIRTIRFSFNLAQ